MPAGNGRRMGVIGKRRARWTARLALAGIAAVFLVTGCTRTVEVKNSGFHTAHVSPPPVTVPQLPPGSFDRARAAGERAAAAAARQAGDPARARTEAEAAVADWPADLAAWDELAADCAALKDELCQHYAAFFRAQVDFVEKLPPRVAVLGFASLAANPVGTHSGNYIYDRRTLETALRLASFYDEQDQLRDVRIVPHPVQAATQAKKKRTDATP